MKAVAVEWTDARGATDDWAYLDQLTDGLCRVLSLGWLIDDDGECLTLAPHLAHEGDDEHAATGVMYIPRHAVRVVHEIELPEGFVGGAGLKVTGHVDEEPPAPIVINAWGIERDRLRADLDLLRKVQHSFDDKPPKGFHELDGAEIGHLADLLEVALAREEE